MHCQCLCEPSLGQLPCLRGLGVRLVGRLLVVPVLDYRLRGARPRVLTHSTLLLSLYDHVLLLGLDLLLAYRRRRQKQPGWLSSSCHSP